jgi:Site-specific recombinase XerD
MKSVTETPLDDLIIQYITEQQGSEVYQDQIATALRSLRTFAELNKDTVVTLSGINRNLLIRWRTWLLETKKCSPATYNNYRRHLFCLLRWCEIQGWDAGITLKNVKAANEIGLGKKTMELIPLRDAMRKVGKEETSALPGWFWVNVMKFLYFSAVRRRQLVGLCWGDIDRKRMTILLRAEHSKTKMEWTIPLAPALLEVLEDVQARSSEVMEAVHGRKLRRDDQVFNVTLFSGCYRENGKPASKMTVDHVSGAFKRIKKSTGMEISAHRFRHTAATKLAKEGDLKELQQLLGHTNLSTTMGYVAPDITRMRNMMGGLTL